MIDTHAKILKQQIKFEVCGDNSPNTSRAASPINRAVSPTTIPRASYDRYPPIDPREMEGEGGEGWRLEQTEEEAWLKANDGGEEERGEQRERRRRRQRRRRRRALSSFDDSSHFLSASGVHTHGYGDATAGTQRNVVTLAGLVQELTASTPVPALAAVPKIELHADAPSGPNEAQASQPAMNDSRWWLREAVLASFPAFTDAVSFIRALKQQFLNPVSAEGADKGVGKGTSKDAYESVDTSKGWSRDDMMRLNVLLLLRAWLATDTVQAQLHSSTQAQTQIRTQEETLSQAAAESAAANTPIPMLIPSLGTADFGAKRCGGGVTDSASERRPSVSLAVSHGNSGHVQQANNQKKERASKAAEFARGALLDLIVIAEHHDGGANGGLSRTDNVQNGAYDFPTTAATSNATAVAISSSTIIRALARSCRKRLEELATREVALAQASSPYLWWKKRAGGENKGGGVRTNTYMRESKRRGSVRRLLSTKGLGIFGSNIGQLKKHAGLGDVSGHESNGGHGRSGGYDTPPRGGSEVITPTKVPTSSGPSAKRGNVSTGKTKISYSAYERRRRRQQRQRRRQRQEKSDLHVTKSRARSHSGYDIMSSSLSSNSPTKLKMSVSSSMDRLDALSVIRSDGKNEKMEAGSEGTDLELDMGSDFEFLSGSDSDGGLAISIMSDPDIDFSTTRHRPSDHADALVRDALIAGHDYNSGLQPVANPHPITMEALERHNTAAAALESDNSDESLGGNGGEHEDGQEGSDAAGVGSNGGESCGANGGEEDSDEAVSGAGVRTARPSRSRERARPRERSGSFSVSDSGREANQARSRSRSRSRVRRPRAVARWFNNSNANALNFSISVNVGISAAQPPPASGQGPPSGPTSLLWDWFRPVTSYPPRVVARAMTECEQRGFVDKICARDLVGTKWTSSASSEAHWTDGGSASVVCWIDWSNRTVQWVAQEILTSGDADVRHRVIEFFIGEFAPSVAHAHLY